MLLDAKVLARIDLNLLVALQHLLEEESVTKAAERLFITQPAMSKTLHRLRETFDDPLFVRSGRGLSPTPRAVELKKQLPLVLSSITSMMAKNEFDPATYEGEIFIMCAEFIAVQVMPALTQNLIKEAPLMTIRLVGENIDIKAAGLEKGDLDFAIEIGRAYSEEYHETGLGHFTPAVWMRTGHPLAGREQLKLNEMLEYPFVQYALLRSPSGDTTQQTRFDAQLKSKGQERKKAMVTAQLMTALNVLWATDSLMMGTMNDLKTDGATYGVVRKSYPKELDFDTTIPIVLVQHTRTIKSPVHRWLKNKITDVVVDTQKKLEENLK